MGTDYRFKLVDAQIMSEAAAKPEPQALTPHRRVLGVLVLFLAAVASLVVPAALDPGAVGDPHAAGLPLPPAIGSCVVLGDSSSVVDTQRTGTPRIAPISVPSVTAVDCAEPHSGEIVMTWPAGREPVAKLDAVGSAMTFHYTRSLTAAAADARCDGWISDYVGWTRYVLGHEQDLWIPNPPLVAGRLLTAPAGSGLPDRHWTACLVQTSAPLYVGRVQGVADQYTPGRPDALSVCLTADHAKVAFRECAQGHTAELLGRASLTDDMVANHSLAVMLGADQVYQLCVTLAKDMTGAADPTYGGRLKIVTESVWQLAAPSNLLILHPGWLVPDCVVKLNGAGELVGSIVGLGDRPLPVR